MPAVISTPAELGQGDVDVGRTGPIPHSFVERCRTLEVSQRDLLISLCQFCLKLIERIRVC